MNEITTTSKQLPETLSELADRVNVGREALNVHRATLRAMDKVGLIGEERERKLKEAQELGETVLDYEVQIGEIMLQVPKATRGVSQLSKIDTDVDFRKSKADVIQEAGFTQKQVERFQLMAEHPDIVERAKAEAKQNNDIVTRSLVLNMVKSEGKKAAIAQAHEEAINQTKSDGVAEVYVENSIGVRLEEKCQLLLTDPPYSTDVEDIDQFVGEWLYEALQCVKDTGFAYVFIGAYPEELEAYLSAPIPTHIELAQVLVWTYKNTLGNNPKDRYKLNWQACLFYRGVNAPPLDCPLTSEQWAVQEINAPDGRQGDRFHPWQKPMEIAERFIRHTTKPGDIVYDPFSGSGTFVLAAAKLGRRGIGFEVNEDTAMIAEQRGVTLCRTSQ